MGETYTVCVTLQMKVEGCFGDVKELEEVLIKRAQEGARALYREGMAGMQAAWVQAHASRYEPVRWRERTVVTPFGTVRVPVRVVRDREAARGGYHSVMKVLRRGLATRELSPAMERAVLDTATKQNYRPAAETLSRWACTPISHWLVWKCVQLYGEKAREQQQRDWWPERPLGCRPQVVVTELDSAILRTQRRGALRQAAQHFPMHVGVQYTGRTPRPGQHRGDVRLTDKTVVVGTGPIGIFGTRVRRCRDRHYGTGKYLSVLLTDGDEGLKYVREREFEGSIWLLDRWHVAEQVRAYVGQDQAAFRAIMAGVYAADSEAALEALRQSDPRRQQRRWTQFRELFGYLLGNRDGIDAWKQIPASLRRSHGSQPAAVRAGSGAIEKHVELCINRRFKWQGRSWNPDRADRLAQLAWLQRSHATWNHWWNAVCLSTVRVNPSWASN
jgi:hypothetical protein